MARPKKDYQKYSLARRDAGVYYAQWWQDGRTQRKSLRTRDLATAQAVLAEFHRQAPDPEESMAAWAANTRSTGRGLISETRVLLRLIELGAEVFVPWGHDHKADLVLIHSGVTQRVQVKSVYTKDGRSVVKASSVIYRQRRAIAKVIQPGDVDLIAAFCPARCECFVTPVTGKGEYLLPNMRPLKSLSDLLVAAPEPKMQPTSPQPSPWIPPSPPQLHY